MANVRPFCFPRLPYDGDNVRVLNDLGEQPELWSHLDAGRLEEFLVQQAYLCGSGDPRRFSPMRGLYAIAVSRLGQEARLRACRAVTDAVERMHRSRRDLSDDGLCSALLPFVYDDEDRQVVAFAVSAWASLRPLDEGDALSGPKAVLGGLDSAPEAWRRGAMVGGLIALGDPQVVHSVAPAYHALTQEGQEVALDVIPHDAGAAVVEFLLDLLERSLEDVGDVPGAVVACLVRFGAELRALGRGVPTVRRVFPAQAVPASLACTFEYCPFDEYAAGIRARLEAIAAREPEPRILPLALKAWGLRKRRGRRARREPGRPRAGSLLATHEHSAVLATATTGTSSAGKNRTDGSHEQDGLTGPVTLGSQNGRGPGGR